MTDICNEKHKRLDEKINIHEVRINNYSGRIDILEQHKSKTETEIKNLIDQIRALVSTIKWFGTLMFGGLLGFFIWYIQQIGR